MFYHGTVHKTNFLPWHCAQKLIFHQIQTIFLPWHCAQKQTFHRIQIDLLRWHCTQNNLYLTIKLVQFEFDHKQFGH